MSDGSQHPLRVVVWGENIHEQQSQTVASIYPDGMHAALAAGLRERLPSAHISTATLAEPEHGLTADRLAQTNVLLWWGHLGHHLVADDTVAAVRQRVLDGMGLIVLHSGHLSKIFTSLMGTSCNLRWREAEDRELIWTVAPAHPISQGVAVPIELTTHEMYGEFFDIPTPDELVFVSNYSGGEVFRSGCCFYRGKGRVFYFSPGHETYPIYYQADVLQVIANGVRWAHCPAPADIEIHRSPESAVGWYRSRT
ncbi:MAG: ThuA domain-containing protein [Pseudomonadales bacterium]